MFSDVEIKLKRNKILFSRDSQCLQELIKLIQLQHHRTFVMWALDCAKLPLAQYEAKYPEWHNISSYYIILWKKDIDVDLGQDK